MMIGLHWLDYLIMGIYFLIVFSIGFLVKPVQKGALADYFLAGRRVTLPIFVASLVSTWYGNLLGVSELAYRQGLVAWLTQGVFWYFSYLFFAFFLVPKIRKFKFFTIPDLIEGFYGKRSAIATALVTLLMLNPATYILSMGILFEIIFGIDPFTGILIGTLVPLIYTLKGGFKAVLYTDFVQFLFMFVGVALVIPCAIFKYGGYNVIRGFSESHLNLSGTGEWTWQLILSWALIAFWALIDANFYQRTFAAKTDKVAKHGIVIATGFWIVFDLMINFIGIYAFTVNPDLEPARSLPLFANQVLPPLLKGIFFTGLIATIMSTFDSLIFASAMTVSKDICHKLGLSEKNLITVNRLAIIATVLIAFLIALKFKSLIHLIYIRGSIGISALLIPVLFALFSKKNLSDLQGLILIISGLVSVSLGFFFFKNSIEPIFLGLAFSILISLIFRWSK